MPKHFVTVNERDTGALIRTAMLYGMPRLRDVLRSLVYPFPYRAYTHKHRCVFIHVPRTGGTSILAALGSRAYQSHCPWWIYEKADRRRFAAYFKFGFVRNPWDRLVSVYSYLAQGGGGAGDHPIGELLNQRYPTFRRFVLEYLDESSIHAHRLLVPQFFYLFDHLGECRVDFVGRFEALASDFAEVAGKIGLSQVALPRINVSSRPSLQECCRDADVVARIGELYRRDVTTFEYSA